MRPIVLAALALLAAPAGAAEPPRFQTASGNIHCEMYGSAAHPAQAGARCALRQFTPTVTAGDHCPRGARHVFAVDGTDSGYAYCSADAIIDSRWPVLGYGQSISHAGVICHSARTGVTCTNGEGHGFSVARVRQGIF